MGERDDFWVFGYGSLMWQPGFEHLEVRSALLRGYHRAFCVYSHHYRGTPGRPGLVLGLDRGGACRGLAFRVAKQNADAVMTYLDERELIGYAYLAKSVPIEAEKEESGDTGRGLVGTGIEWIGLLIVALVAVGWLWSHWPDLNGARAYRKLRERVAKKADSDLAESIPPLEFAELVTKRAPAASRSTHRVVELYLRESFGGEELSREERGELKEVLTDAVRALRKTA